MKADHPIGRPFHFSGGPHGVLLLHGFAGTPGHMRWLGEHLRDAGYAVSAPLLPGHGTAIGDLYRSNWQAWLQEARLAYIALREKCETVTVAGFSMGGTLALILAEEYPVDGLICLSAAIRLYARLTWAAPVVRLFMPYITRSTVSADDDYDLLAAYDAGYEGIATGRVRDLRRLISLAEKNLFAVVAPALIVQPVNDHTIHPVSAERILRGISSKEKEILWLDRSRHVLTIGADREIVLDAMLKHLAKIDLYQSKLNAT